MATVSKKRLVKKTRTVRRLIDFIYKGGAVATQIKSHFSMYCDCDITTWLIDRIEARDPNVYNRLLVILRAPDPVVVERLLAAPPVGKLLDRYCFEGKLMGRFSTGSDEIVLVVIDEASDMCLM